MSNDWKCRLLGALLPWLSTVVVRNFRVRPQKPIDIAHSPLLRHFRLSVKGVRITIFRAVTVDPQPRLTPMSPSRRHLSFKSNLSAVWHVYEALCEASRCEIPLLGRIVKGLVLAASPGTGRHRGIAQCDEIGPQMAFFLFLTNPIPHFPLGERERGEYMSDFWRGLTHGVYPQSSCAVSYPVCAL